jgi:hypothetical protein
MSFAISLMAVGCGGNEQQSNIPGNTQTEGGLSVNTAGAETEKNKEDNENKERVPDTASDVSLDEPISYTYQNHPYSFMAGEKELAMGNFYSVELDVNAKDEYQNLQKKLDELGKDYKNEILDFFTGSENELQELIDSGWFIAYELDHDYIPVRSDGRVFSYSLLDYTYLAGAHGVAHFKTSLICSILINLMTHMK